MTSLDIDFLTLRNVMAMNPNNTPVESGNIFVSGNNGNTSWTNSININSITVSSISTSTISTNTINTTNISTNNINLNNGAITGVSTINGIIYPPPEDINYWQDISNNIITPSTGITTVNISSLQINNDIVIKNTENSTITSLSLGTNTGTYTLYNTGNDSIAGLVPSTLQLYRYDPIDSNDNQVMMSIYPNGDIRLGQDNLIPINCEIIGNLSVSSINGFEYPISSSINYWKGIDDNTIQQSTGISLIDISGCNMSITSDSFYFKSTDPSGTETFKIELQGSNCNIYRSSINPLVNATYINNTGGGPLVLTTAVTSNAISIDGTGTKVGINNIDPQACLHISTISTFDGIVISNNQQTAAVFYELATTSSRYSWYNTGEISPSGTGLIPSTLQLYRYDSIDPNLNQIMMSIYPNGNIELGESFDTPITCQIFGDLIVSSINGQPITAATSGPSAIVGPTSNTLIWQQSGNNAYYIGGNVGISTTTPAYDLDISGTIRAIDLKISTINGISATDDIFWKSTTAGKIYTSTTVTNVGINTNNPQYTLDVLGSVRATNFVNGANVMMFNSIDSTTATIPSGYRFIYAILLPGVTAVTLPYVNDTNIQIGDTIFVINATSSAGIVFNNAVNPIGSMDGNSFTIFTYTSVNQWYIIKQDTGYSINNN